MEVEKWLNVAINQIRRVGFGLEEEERNGGSSVSK